MKNILLRKVAAITLLAFTPMSFAATHVIIADENTDYQLIKDSIAAVTAIPESVPFVNAALDEIGVLVIDIDDATAQKISQIPGVDSVTRDFSIEFDVPTATSHQVSFETAAANPPFTMDDDFFFNYQWGHDAIDVPEAWELGYRGKGVRIAVLDSGIDGDHPDLVPNLNAALSISFVEGEDWNTLPDTPSSHGTHVAGTIAAADNGYGVIGVAPEAEIVAVKVLSEFTGSGSFASAFLGMFYSVMIEADIINMSLGALIPRKEEGAKELIKAFKRLAKYAYKNGVTIIAAAGNQAFNADKGKKEFYALPAQLPKVLAISATGPVGWGRDLENPNYDISPSYTNYGKRLVDFAAPGGNFDGLFLPDFHDPCPIYGNEPYPCWVFDLVFSTDNGGWSWNAGTSMASPHAAGVAALIINRLDEPERSKKRAKRIKKYLKRGADDLGDRGKDPFFGKGRINAFKSVAPKK